MNRSEGFTLIELLVVIAIIGILSSVVLASLSTARYKANDAKRRSDLQSLQTALEMYYSAHSSYPSTGGAWYGIASPATVQGAGTWIPGLVADGDIGSLPEDPAYPSPQTAAPCNGSWPAMYLYNSQNGSGYKLLDHCAPNSAVARGDTADPMYDPVRPTWAWQVCSGSDCSD